MGEEGDEKLIADHVESITSMIDKEKFAREQQHMDFVRWADVEHQQVAKRQCVLETETRDAAQEIRVEHQGMAKERIDHQNQIVESIATFVQRYRRHLDS